MWMKIDGQVQKVMTKDEFDLKKGIAEGDLVEYISDTSGRESRMINGEKCLVAVGRVKSVHRYFCMVTTPGNRIETVNWWDILRVNKGNFGVLQLYQEMLKGIE